MSDYRSIFFEMAANVLPKRFFVARGGCGGEAIVAAPNEHLARELAARIWNANGASHEPPEWFTVEEVPLILSPENWSMSPESSDVSWMKIIGGSEYFGDQSEIREAIETARED